MVNIKYKFFLVAKRSYRTIAQFYTFVSPPILALYKPLRVKSNVPLTKEATSLKFLDVTDIVILTKRHVAYTLLIITTYYLEGYLSYGSFYHEANCS